MSIDLPEKTTMMKTLTIKDDSNQTVSYKAEIMEGTPPEMGTLYTLYDDHGKQAPQSLTVTVGKNVNVVFFSGIEVKDGRAYGFDYTVTRARTGELGAFVSYA
ncbi:hypothetical protein [Burkholderia vietnamiensis]|nr:hypothetical protein [Burkholderia vietnamiensis]